MYLRNYQKGVLSLCPDWLADFDKILAEVYDVFGEMDFVVFWEEKMAWKKPSAVEISCGMEINMYGPGEDDERGGDLF